MCYLAVESESHAATGKLNRPAPSANQGCETLVLEVSN